MITNWWGRQNAAPLKFNPKPSEAVFLFSVKKIGDITPTFPLSLNFFTSLDLVYSRGFLRVRVMGAQGKSHYMNRSVGWLHTQSCFSGVALTTALRLCVRTDPRAWLDMLSQNTCSLPSTVLKQRLKYDLVTTRQIIRMCLVEF